MCHLAQGGCINKVLIFGNSGSGKSTLAKHISALKSLSHLDLDTLAWQNTQPVQRMPLSESATQIEAFIQDHNEWVIEGCYTDLLELAVQHCTEIIFLNLPVAACINNAKNRPWEPHKYPSKQAQDQNLEMLLEWITQYDTRSDTFSKAAHQTFYDNYHGKKSVHHRNHILAV